MLQFKPMGPEHLEQVLQIEDESFSAPWSFHAFLYEITCNNLAFYAVAKSKGDIVGYAGMWVILEDAHITNLAVSPRLRGRNYGRRLMEEMMRRASLLGASRMTLEVRVSNLVAQRLYTSLGFVERGRRREYYSDNNEDAIIMWKDDLALPREQAGL